MWSANTVTRFVSLPSRTSASPPFYHPIFATSHKSSRTTNSWRFRSPRDSPYFIRILDSRNCGPCSNIPNFNAFVCWPVFYWLVINSRKWSYHLVYPDKPSRPSGDTATLKTQDVWPEKDATVPPGVDRTSCNTSLLSSEALNSNWLINLGNILFVAEKKGNIKTYIRVRRPCDWTHRHGMRGKCDRQSACFDVKYVNLSAFWGHSNSSTVWTLSSHF